MIEADDDGVDLLFRYDTDMPLVSEGDRVRFKITLGKTGYYDRAYDVHKVKRRRRREPEATAAEEPEAAAAAEDPGAAAAAEEPEDAEELAPAMLEIVPHVFGEQRREEHRRRGWSIFSLRERAAWYARRSSGTHEL